MTKNEPLLYQKMTASAHTELVCAGVACDEARQLARNIVKRFCAAYGGEIVRVPLLRSKEKQARDELIRKDYETMSVAQICAKYRVSLGTARNAVKGVKKHSNCNWSESDVEKLISSWDSSGTGTRIAGKTKKQITNKATYLGLGSGRRSRLRGSGFND